MVTKKCYVKRSLTAPVLSGSTVGKIEYLVNGEVVLSESICLTETVEKIDYRWCLQKLWGRFFGLQAFALDGIKMPE